MRGRMLQGLVGAKRQGCKNKQLKIHPPKTAKAPDTILQDTLGDARIRGVIPKNVPIENVRIIAGAETSTKLRYSKDSSEEYGGEPLQWQKKRWYNTRE